MSIDSRFAQFFSDDGFLRMLAQHPLLDFLESAVALWYCLKDEQTPLWAKATIVAALGYFICPVDLIPDALPVIGWSDDAGVIAAALGVVDAFVSSRHRQQARQLLGR